MDVTLRLQFIEIEPLYREGGAYTKRPASLEADNGGSAGADLGQVTDRFNERPGLERS